MRLNVLTFAAGFLSRINKEESAVCKECGAVESIEHVLFDCPKYEEQRSRMQQAIEVEQNEILDDSHGNIKLVCDSNSLRIIGDHPKPVLNFIKECNFWSESC